MFYDLIIIGAGPGGYNAALRAAHEGLKVLVAEKEKIGGVCLNEGCIPSKSLLYSAKIYDGLKHGEKYGVTAENPSISQDAVIDRKNKVVRTLVAGIKSSLKKAGVEVVSGNAVISGKEGDNFKVCIGDDAHTAKHLIIAAGSSAVIPPVSGVKEQYENGFVVTNREILDLREIPKRLVVIGGGVIGLEMASYYNSVGSEVTIIEMLPKIAGNTDAELSELLMKNYAKNGMTFKLGAKLTRVTDNSVIFEKDGVTQELPADKVLMSVGRSANTEGLGLDTLGILFDRKGIATDERCMTNVEGVYAVGDINGKIMLAHTAYREGEVAVNSIIGVKDIIDYSIIPSVIYTNPEIASVGDTEQSAADKGYDVSAMTLSMRFSGRYLAENDGGDGICKIIADKKSKTLLGVHMISNYASELIVSAGMMIQSKTAVEDLRKIVFPHPSVAEIIREGIFELNI